MIHTELKNQDNYNIEKALSSIIANTPHHTTKMYEAVKNLNK